MKEFIKHYTALFYWWPYLIFGDDKYKRLAIVELRKNLFQIENGLNTEREKINKSTENDKLELSDLEFETEKELLMTEETALEILSELEKFEEANRFIEKNVSLSKLAVLCNTNNKYLSNVIHVYKLSNFSDYINRLRVNYVVQKLDEDPVFREYKVSVVAKEAGFSSSNKLAAAFKRELGVLPSDYIKSLGMMKSSFV